MEQYGYIKTGIPHTCGEDLVYNLVLPESVHTAVWLLPLIDTRLWYGLPAQGVQNYTEPTTGKFYPHGKPDRRNVLFGDWDIPNILGVKPFKMICAFILPSFFGWILATLLQVFYILHIMFNAPGWGSPTDSTEACFGAAGWICVASVEEAAKAPIAKLDKFDASEPRKAPDLKA